MAKALTRNDNVLDDENADLKVAVRQCIAELESANRGMAQRQIEN